MLSEPIKEISMEKEKYRVRKTITKGDLTKELEVVEVENGFIITIEERGYKGKEPKREWYSNEKKYISKTNPLDDKEDKTASDVKGSILDVINNLDI